ncbi:MAG: cysteine desulfurase [Candidatus Dormibacteria bacterium]
MTVHAPGMETARRLRADFPVLAQLSRGKPIAYLDSGATSQKPLVVIEAMDHYYREYNANIHRGVYEIAERATAAFEGARRQMADLLGAAASAEIIFVRNATEAVNLVAHSWGGANLGRGDLMVSTVMEHHSNLVPWQMLAGRTGCRIEYVDIDQGGRLRLDHLDELLARGPKLVAVTAMSNVLGTINPVSEICARAHRAGALVLVDAAQAAPHSAIDVSEWGADFVAVSGHKMGGPTGTGVLWARRELLEEMPPFLGGGDMISSVTLERSTWNDVPWKFEAGTSDIGGVIGLGAAAAYLGQVGFETIEGIERELAGLAFELLGEVPGLTIFGPPPDERGGLVSFTLEGIHPHDLASILDAEGVCVRAGHHCAQPLMDRLGVVATTRASFWLYNLPEEVERLAAGLHRARTVFGL